MAEVFGSSWDSVFRSVEKAIAKKAGQAVHVLDRFHLMTHFSKALVNTGS
jgi:transposase